MCFNNKAAQVWKKLPVRIIKIVVMVMKNPKSHFFLSIVFATELNVGKMGVFLKII